MASYLQSLHIANETNQPHQQYIGKYNINTMLFPNVHDMLLHVCDTMGILKKNYIYCTIGVLVEEGCISAFLFHLLF